MDTYIEWTREKMLRFEAAYREALNARAHTFVFEGHTFLVTYARYLLEYLKTMLGE